MGLLIGGSWEGPGRYIRGVTKFFHRLRSTCRLLRVVFRLFTTEPDKVDEVELLEDLVVAVQTGLLFRSSRAE